MNYSKKRTSLFRQIGDLAVIIVSMAGFVPKHATIPRAVSILVSLLFSLYLGRFQASNTELAVAYFTISEVCYIGFIFATLSERGLRKFFIRKWGSEEEGYLAFEAVLGFLFFHNGICLGYISSATPGNFTDIIPPLLFYAIVPLLFVSGFIIKILAARAVTIDIYYWKDMFVGRKISEFVVTGPYKYFSNPMYGIGQLQAYAAALWYGSVYGLVAAFINQGLIFTFYFLSEKRFINKTYMNNQ